MVECAGAHLGGRRIEVEGAVSDERFDETVRVQEQPFAPFEYPPQRSGLGESPIGGLNFSSRSC